MTTPHYNTAVIAVNQGAFPYGGIELARLFDRQQDVARSVAGTAPAAFGLVVRDSRRARVFVTQVGRSSIGRTPSLRLMRGNRAISASGGPGHVCAGRFRSLKATGTISGSGLLGRTTHRFTSRSITTSWTLDRIEDGERSTHR